MWHASGVFKALSGHAPLWAARASLGSRRDGQAERGSASLNYPPKPAENEKLADRSHDQMAMRIELAKIAIQRTNGGTFFDYKALSR
ncbi:hypothetical protein [Caballeronia telluris]|jgi:hypothetical protein|uniref:hypothetical protein n=1 Tax=Caballeronia telluris TaxID=326475 RepID=UPI000F73CFF1|nr:hypothetical protein [Caballeronia telluris]